MNDAVELAEWILKNRKGPAFKDYTMATLCKEIVNCAEARTMMIVKDENDKIAGVYFGEFNHPAKSFFIYDILATNTWVLKEMLLDFQKKYPDYSICGVKKHGIKRHFDNAQQILERL